MSDANEDVPAMSEALLAHNLHVHTLFSDGSYTPEQVVGASIKQGLAAVGITDHYENRKLSFGTPSVTLDALDAYVSTIRELAGHVADDIRVLAGLEVSAARHFTDLEAIDWDTGPFDCLDFLLFEDVGEDVAGGLSLEEFLDIRRHLHLPVGLAHTDLAGSLGVQGTGVLLDALAENDVFVELCASPRHADWVPVEFAPGPKPEPYRATGPVPDVVPIPFYRSRPEAYAGLGDHGIWVSIGTDMHTEIDQIGHVHDAVQFVRENGLVDRLVVAKL